VILEDHNGIFCLSGLLSTEKGGDKIADNYWFLAIFKGLSGEA
jgi:hypothetical protein